MIIDTDVVIRYLTGDDIKKAKRFEVLLKSGRKLLLTDVTFAEIYWTLSSFYKFPKTKILKVLGALINFRNIECNTQVLQKVITLLEKHNISFIDAYNAVVATISKNGEILSFDKGFDKIEGIKRVDP